MFTQGTQTQLSETVHDRVGLFFNVQTVKDELDKEKGEGRNRDRQYEVSYQ